MGKNAAWSVSSCKPGNGVNTLRDDDLETFWQSDGLQPHLINIQFQKKVRLQLVVLSIRAGDGFHNLKEMKSVELVKPSGWVCVSMSGSDPPDTFVNTFMLQISILSNHLNGPRPCVCLFDCRNRIPRQPFQFTSTEFLTYSTLR
ncbi:BnaC07g03470D [Brassica napus]|uniref:BnaC07g03470D protein n=1 Tax=Brassica napus TaxID=3708 RepID=A0A078GFA5_BRANA|nr:BnaC07g03470D [Brassica napus]